MCFQVLLEADDLDRLANQYNCSVAVITSQDGAWHQDPFAASPLYRLVETEVGAWRIYRRREQSTSSLFTASPTGRPVRSFHPENQLSVASPVCCEAGANRP